MNSVNLIGNLGQDPKFQSFESGSVKVDISIGIKRYRGKDKPSTTDWIACEAWGKTAELISEHFKKGSRIGITGSLEQQTWEKDGEKRSKLFVSIENVHFCQKKDEGSSSSSNYSSSSSSSGGGSRF